MWSHTDNENKKTTASTRSYSLAGLRAFRLFCSRIHLVAVQQCKRKQRYMTNENNFIEQTKKI